MKKFFAFFAASTFLLSFFACSPDEEPSPDLPEISITDAIVDEGQDAKFIIYLDKSSEEIIEVSVNTKDQTAIAGQDYDELESPLIATFNPGDTVLSLYVSTLTDEEEEEDETFQVELSNPQNSVIAKTNATGTIVNVEPTPENSFYMEAKIDGKPWKSAVSGFFGAEMFLNTYSLAGYGTTDGSQIAFAFTEEIEAITYGITENPLPADDDKAFVTYTPNFFGGGDSYVAQEGGEIVIESLNFDDMTTKGTFKFTAVLDNGDKVEVTEGKFFVPVND